MRCKEGDLVVVSGRSETEFPENLGRFGTVRSRITCWCCRNSGDWWVEPQSTFVGVYWGLVCDEPVEVSFCDTSLTPIRPGDLVEDPETTKELERV